MKKIVWIMGEKGTGKTTFIENILSNKDNIREIFGFENSNIVVLNKTMIQKKDTKSRHDIIMDGINNFLINEIDADILLIKGEIDDIDFEKNNPNKQNTLLQSIVMIPDIEKEVFLLDVLDHDISYYRMTNSDWWKKDPEKFAKLIPRDKWDAIVDYHNDKVLSLQDVGIKVQIVDTTNGYSLLESNYNYMDIHKK